MKRAQDQITKKLDGKELDGAIFDVLKDGNVSGLRELLETYDDVTERIIDCEGWKALHVAAMFGYVDVTKNVAKLLIQNGADVNAVDNDNCTSLHFACKRADVDLAKLLIQNGADVNAVNNVGCTSLHVAGDRGLVDVGKLLMQNGADVNAVDKDNRSVLHHSVYYSIFDRDRKSVPLILELLCFGAKIDKKALENVKNDKTGLLVQIEERLEKLKNSGRCITNLCSNEENKFKWNLAFCLTLKHKVTAFKAYYSIRSFITYHGIFMAPGYDLGKESVWRRDPFYLNFVLFV